MTRALRDAHDRAMCCDDDKERLAYRVLATLLPTEAIVTAIYQPDREAPAWAAPLLGRRAAWTPDPTAERGADVGQWPMIPYPLQLPATLGEAPRWVPLRHLRDILIVSAPSDLVPSAPLPAIRRDDAAR